MSAEGQALINSLSQLEGCALGLKADIQVLQSQVNNKLDTAEKPSLIQQSVTEATLLLDPKIAAAQIAIGIAMNLAQGATIKAGNAFTAAQTAEGVANTARGVANTAKGTANTARAVAKNALDLGEIASIKAGDAFHKATQARQVAQTAQGAAQTATTTANNAKGIAGNALNKATDALSKYGGLALQVLNLAGAVAGLLSLYGLINSVFPRLDAHDRELTQLGNDLSKAISLAGLGINKANAAQATADTAYQQSLHASSLAGQANTTSNTALHNSIAAQQEANYAVGQANKAINDAAQAITKSDKAILDASDAIQKANTAISKVNTLESKVTQAQATADDAIAKITKLEPEIAIAKNIADQAKQDAYQAQIRIRVLEPKVADAQNTADTADKKAEQALNGLKIWEPKIINAQTTADISLGLATPTFTATQLQAKQLQAHDLEIAQLKTKTLTPTIIQNNIYQATPAQIANITNQVTNNVTNNLQGQLQQVNNNTTNITNIQNVINNGVAMTPQQELKIDNTLLGLAALTALVNGIPGAVTSNLRPPIDAINSQTKPNAIINATAAGTCRTTQPGGCMRNLVDNSTKNAADNAANNVTNNINNALDVAGLGLLKVIDNKLGAQITNGGISGAMGRLSNFLGVGRAFQFFNLIANLHNAYMLSNALKTTMLEVVASVGNATGLLQTPEGDNVDLNAEYNKGMNIIMEAILGKTLADDVKTTWKKYNRIYQAATNSVAAMSNMMNAIGNVVQTSAEYTGRIGNALQGAGVIAENSYAWMSEKLNAKMSKFLTFETKIGTTTAFLEVVNEIAESVIEGQQAATEFQTANTEFIKAVKDAQRDKGTDNTATATAETTAKTEATKIPSITPGKTEEEDLLNSLASKLFN